MALPTGSSSLRLIKSAIFKFFSVLSLLSMGALAVNVAAARGPAGGLYKRFFTLLCLLPPVPAKDISFNAKFMVPVAPVPCYRKLTSGTGLVEFLYAKASIFFFAELLLLLLAR